MAVTSTATSNFNKLVQELIRVDLERLLRTPPPHLMPGNYIRADLIKGSNGTLRFLAFPDMTVLTPTFSAGTPPWLTEGTPPSDEALTIAYEEMTAHQAGRVIRITDVAEMESPVDLVAQASDKIARNMLMTADQYLGNVIKAGTNVIYAGTSNTSTVGVDQGDVITAANVRAAVASLEANGVPRFPDGYYHGIIHPYVAADFMGQTSSNATFSGGWIDTRNYADPTALLTGEIGAYAGVRFMQSANAGVKALSGTSGEDVYSTVIFGPEAFAFGDFGSAQVILTPPGGHSDPLKQNIRVGWKAMFGARILEANGSRYVRIESASSAAPATGS